MSLTEFCVGQSSTVEIQSNSIQTPSEVITHPGKPTAETQT